MNQVRLQDHAGILHALHGSVKLARLPRLLILLAAIGTLALLPHVSMAHEASDRPTVRARGHPYMRLRDNSPVESDEMGNGSIQPWPVGWRRNDSERLR